MALEKINFSYPKGTLQSVFDNEALTALELAAKTSKKVDECVEIVNGVEQTAIEATAIVEDMYTIQNQFITDNSDTRAQLINDNQEYLDGLTASKTQFETDLNNSKSQFEADLTASKTQFETNMINEVNAIVTNSKSLIQNDVAEKISDLINDGTIESIINDEIIGDVKEQIKDISINVKLFGAIGDGVVDDTISIQNAINSLENGVVLLPKGIYKVTDITLKNGVSLVGNNATIKYNSAILNGNQSIEGLTFDGEFACREIQILGDNVTITDNIFLNTKATNTGSGATRTIEIGSLNGEPRYNITIKSNTFDGCEPYSENGTTGDNVGTARFIIVNRGFNVNILNNTFKNLKGFEDGDCIYLASDWDNTVRYPFTTSVGCSSLTQVIIDSNNFYLKNCKCAIKCQTSGAIITNNTILFSSDDDISYACFRCHSSKDIVINNNKVMLQSNKISGIFLVERCENVVVSNNSAISSINIPLEINGHAFHLAYTKNCVIKNNDIHLINFKSIISAIYNSGLFVDNNTFKTVNNVETANCQFTYDSNQSTTLTAGIIYDENYINNIWVAESVNPLNELLFKRLFIGGVKVQGLLIKTNITSLLNIDINVLSNSEIELNQINSDLSVKLLVSRISGQTDKIKSLVLKKVKLNTITTNSISNVLVEDCTSVNTLYDFFTLNASDIVTIKNNSFECDVTRNLLTVQTGSFIVNFINNFIKSYNTLISKYNNEGFELKNFIYSPSYKKLANLDYGTTTGRPNLYTVSNYHQYYDTTLNKLIFWNGTEWKDFSGITV